MAESKIVPFVEHSGMVPRNIGMAQVEIKDGLVTATVTVPHSEFVKSVDQIVSVVTLGISINYKVDIQRRTEG